MEQDLQKLINSSQKIIVLQADNPDADSLASSLALEQILGEMGKDVHLYCGVDMPGYLKYLSGWDRVSSELPKDFDLSIIVDASTTTLFQKLSESSKIEVIKNKPCVVLDHHYEVENPIDFAAVNIIDTNVASTGELIHRLALNFNWPIDKLSAEFIMTSILGDTQGLSNDLTTAETYRVMAKLVESGVDRPALEEKRRAMSKMHKDIFRYKARLIERTEFHADGRLALIDIPNNEINEYSPLYNPNALIQYDQLQTEGVLISVSIKHYDDGRITASIRSNSEAPIAAKLASHFNGGGHKYSAGFKVIGNTDLNKVKSDCVAEVIRLLNDQDKQ